MKNSPIKFIATFLFFTVVGAPGQDSFVDGVDLTSVKAPWSLRILGNDLDIADVKLKDERSVYIMMASASTKLNVSVFIEPANNCKTSEMCRNQVLGLGNPAWGKFQDLSKGKIKDFYYFEFYRPEVRGQPIKMLDMYAECVSQGYWIDLHISKVLYTKEDHALFEKIVGSAELVPKTGRTTTWFDTQLTKGQSSSASWLSRWDNQECQESFEALSPISTKEITLKDWAVYCLSTTEMLGKNTSRQLIAAFFTRGVPEKTDRPVAILAYQSAFAKRSSVAETVGLLLENNGTWTVTNYSEE